MEKKIRKKKLRPCSWGDSFRVVFDELDVPFVAVWSDLKKISMQIQYKRKEGSLPSGRILVVWRGWGSRTCRWGSRAGRSSTWNRWCRWFTGRLLWIDRGWSHSSTKRERNEFLLFRIRSIHYLSTVVDDSFLLVGGLSRVVDTVAVCGDDSRRSLPLLEVFVVRPLLDEDDEDDASFGSFLGCVVDGNDGPWTTRFGFVAVVFVLLLLLVTADSVFTFVVDRSTRRYRE